MTAMTTMPAPLRAPAGQPALRRLPVPSTEPRPALRVVHDHEPDGVPGQGTLSLDGTPLIEAPAPRPAPPPAPRRDPRPDPRLVRGPAAVAAFCARVPTPADLLPDPQRWAAQFVQAAVEVSGGYRPAGQLIRWTSDEVYATVARRGRLAARSGARAVSRGERVSSARARVHSVRICSPRDGVVEACAVVRDRERTRAVALRMEGLDGRWRVTALEIG
jgi:hypothetical protein